MKKFNFNNSLACRFLGVCDKTMRHYLKRYPELKKMKEDYELKEQFATYVDSNPALAQLIDSYDSLEQFLDHIKSTKGYRYHHNTEKEKEKFLNKMTKCFKAKKTFN